MGWSGWVTDVVKKMDRLHGDSMCDKCMLKYYTMRFPDFLRFPFSIQEA